VSDYVNLAAESLSYASQLGGLCTKWAKTGGPGRPYAGTLGGGWAASHRPWAGGARSNQFAASDRWTGMGFWQIRLSWSILGSSTDQIGSYDIATAL